MLNRLSNNDFTKKLFAVALPITVQSLLSSSFSLIDQLMVGRLGTVSIASVAIAGKFSSFYSIILASLISAYGIVQSQYVGAEDNNGEGKALKIVSLLSLVLTLLFLIPSLVVPSFVIGLYIKDYDTVKEASRYLMIVSTAFPAQAIALILSTILRSREKATYPMYSSLFSALVNCILNYIFIFILEKGTAGAAGATAISQYSQVFLLIIPASRLMKRGVRGENGAYLKTFMKVFLPILFCEFFWGLGENVYASVYGHMGTVSAASYSLTGPVQSLMIGALTGLSQASGILIGKELGRKDYDSAYSHSRAIIKWGIVMSAVLSLLIIIFRGSYLKLYSVEKEVYVLSQYLLLVYAFYAPVKVSNMIIGGIIRSGGRTDLSMYVDLIGTWGIGVPLALISSRLLNFPIYLVYASLSFEEVVRVVIVSRIFVKKTWMESIAD